MERSHSADSAIDPVVGAPHSPPPAPELAHDALVQAEHLRLVQRANEVKSHSVVLEEAAEEIVDLRAALTAAEATRQQMEQERDAARGTFACPICGKETIHAHDENDIFVWLDAKASTYGYRLKNRKWFVMPKDTLENELWWVAKRATDADCLGNTPLGRRIHDLLISVRDSIVELRAVTKEKCQAEASRDALIAQLATLRDDLKFVRAALYEDAAGAPVWDLLRAVGDSLERSGGGPLADRCHIMANVLELLAPKLTAGLAAARAVVPADKEV